MLKIIAIIIVSVMVFLLAGLFIWEWITTQIEIRRKGNDLQELVIEHNYTGPLAKDFPVKLIEHNCSVMYDKTEEKPWILYHNGIEDMVAKANNLTALYFMLL